MNIAYTCKICKKPGIAMAEDCSPEYLEMLSPMLTCDRCFDIREKLVKSTASIGNICAALARSKLLRLDKEQSAALESRMRNQLTVATQNYAAAIAKQWNMSRSVWMEDFVEQLMEAPDKVGHTLQTYRKLLKQAIATPEPVQASLPHND